MLGNARLGIAKNIPILFNLNLPKKLSFFFFNVWIILIELFLVIHYWIKMFLHIVPRAHIWHWLLRDQTESAVHTEFIYLFIPAPFPSWARFSMCHLRNASTRTSTSLGKETRPRFASTLCRRPEPTWNSLWQKTRASPSWCLGSWMRWWRPVRRLCPDCRLRSKRFFFFLLYFSVWCVRC